MRGKKANSILKRVLLMLCVLLAFGAVTAFAAEKPATVKSLKASTSGTTIRLSWKKAANAKGYNIYMVNKDGSLKLYKKTTKTSYSVKKCKYNQKYTFKVCAYNSSQELGGYSNQASATPKLPKPGTPKYFQVTALGNQSAALSWTAVSNANGYVVERYNTSTKKYEIIKTIRSKSTRKTTIYNLKDGVTCKYRVRSYREAQGERRYSNSSEIIKITGVKFSKEVDSIRNARYTVTVKKTVKASNLSKGISFSLKKGTKLTVTAKSGTTVTGYLKNGNKIKVSRSALKYTGLDCSPKNDYSKGLKESFVNTKGLKSNTDWLIWVSEYKVKVNVFRKSNGKWRLEKVMPCVVGRWNYRTPSGLKRIIKAEPYGKDGEPVIYFTRGVNGTTENPEGNAFHSKIGNVMSKSDSHGCIRLEIDDLKYILYNCPVGTTVYVY